LNEEAIATEVIEWARNFGSTRKSSVYIQCKDKNIENILSRSPKEETVTIYDTDYKILRKTMTEKLNKEKILESGERTTEETMPYVRPNKQGTQIGKIEVNEDRMEKLS